MKRFKYSELSEKSKKRAIRDYRQGLRDSDYEDVPSLKECSKLIEDTDNDVDYDKDGKMISHY